MGGGSSKSKAAVPVHVEEETMAAAVPARNTAQSTAVVPAPTEQMQVTAVVNASVPVFENFERLIQSQDLVEKETDNPTMFNWLKEALPLAHLSPALKQSIQRLLGHTEFVSAFDQPLNVFEPLQDFCQDPEKSEQSVRRHLQTD